MAKKSTPALTPAAEARKRGLKFIGPEGRHLSGIPATHLAPDDVGQLTIVQIEAALSSGLYEMNGGSSDEF